MVLKRNWAYLVSLALLIVLFAVFFSDYNELRTFINSQYLRFKEFVFLLNNVERTKKLPLTEEAIRRILERYGLELKRISEITNGYEVEVKEVRAELLPKLIKELEKYGNLSEFKAVDNTGEGRFFLKFRITHA